MSYGLGQGISSGMEVPINCCMCIEEGNINFSETRNNSSEELLRKVMKHKTWKEVMRAYVVSERAQIFWLR